MGLFGTRLHGYNHSDLSFLVEEIFFSGVYDVGALPNAPVIVDCGANIGVATFFFVRTYPGCKVLAFEPDPAAFAMLSRNVTENDWSNVEIYNLALDRKPGKIPFYLESNRLASPMMSGVRERQTDGPAIIVDSISLSSKLTFHVDLVKIDVEGMELNIMDDLESSGSLERIDRLIVEYHHHLHAAQDCLSDFLGRLERSGFGYELGARHPRGQLGANYQDVMIYAYRKMIGAIAYQK